MEKLFNRSVQDRNICLWKKNQQKATEFEKFWGKADNFIHYAVVQDLKFQKWYVLAKVHKASVPLRPIVEMPVRHNEMFPKLIAAICFETTTFQHFLSAFAEKR